ncbi:MAG: CopG family transcriptional regulator [Steroidobacteraceae bacterium]
MKISKVVHLEERTARLTILIDPRKKAVFERLCAEEDLTPSQVVRRMIRGYIETRLGRPWTPGEEGPAGRGGTKRRNNRS